ncbi:MAG: radical SAM protein [Myxococcales bacterium]|nr:radical SAM protein [Myxococcales bacterium]MCB9531485.1 radical SAM protein [Myxococcales bacterium]
MTESALPVAPKAVERENAAHEKRNWIRLTSMCNNLCTFCLDTLAHNGTITSDDEVQARIIEGRRNGATRLILSGGEPTIHPNFIKFVKIGRAAGYRRVQTVTNGRMLSYPEFMQRALDAGLQEITFSVHGHNAKVHDALVGVPGAFDEEVRAIQLALDDGRPIINIDVCLNKGNVRKLPELLDKFIAMGVKEFDLLHLIPFGMAWDKKHRDQLVYDIEEAMPYVQAALRYSDRPDVHIWFNRFPPPYLESYEHLIQDPYKLNDEARGRFEEYELWLTRDMPISCREPDRCPRCYLKNFCDSMEDTMTRTREARFDAYRVDVTSVSTQHAAPYPLDYLWIKAPSLAEAVEALGAGDGALVLELDGWDGLLERLDADGKLDGRPVARVVCGDADALPALLADARIRDVTALLTADVAAALLDRMPDGHARLALALPNYELASDAAEQLPDVPAFFTSWKGAAVIENIPECVSGVAPRPRLRVLDARALRAKPLDYAARNFGDHGGRGSLLQQVAELSVGDPAKTRMIQERLGLLKPEHDGPKLDLFGFTGDYVRHGYYSKSRRCEECPRHESCEGLHINTVRSKGYALLRPIAPETDG